MTWLFVLAPFVGLAACVVTHVMLCRSLPPRFGRLQAIAVSFVTGGGVVAALALAYAGVAGETANRGAMVGWGIAYGCFVHCYLLGFYVLGETARRIRLLAELTLAGPRGLTLAELLGAYNASMILEARVARLLTGGQIVERDGRYVVQGRSMLNAAKVMVLMKRLLWGRSTEAALERPDTVGASR